MNKVSRDIRFRGKSLYGVEWVYGGYYKHLSRTICLIGDGSEESYYKHLIFNSGFSDWNMPKPLECIEVHGNTVGQYTGLKDKNGKEIYEGDILIVVTYRYEEPLIDTTCVVEYDNEHCLYNFTEIGYGEIYSYSMIEIGDSFKYELEVIGNIHDNHELLEEKQ